MSAARSSPPGRADGPPPQRRRPIWPVTDHHVCPAGAVPLEELGLRRQSAQQQAGSSSSSRSSSPGLSDGTHELLTSELERQRQLPGGEGDAESGLGRQPRPPITYLLIYEDERVSMGIFCLPARAKIPLHNHPGMTVLSRCGGGEQRASSPSCLCHWHGTLGAGKEGAVTWQDWQPLAARSLQTSRTQPLLCRRVLYGEMHVASFDWAEGGVAGAAPLPREARAVLDASRTAADEPVVLFPRAGGNIHEFTAVTDCAVLDLMSPPYSTGAVVLQGRRMWGTGCVRRSGAVQESSGLVGTCRRASNGV